MAAAIAELAGAEGAELLSLIAPHKDQIIKVVGDKVREALDVVAHKTKDALQDYIVDKVHPTTGGEERPYKRYCLWVIAILMLILMIVIIYNLGQYIMYGLLTAMLFILSYLIYDNYKQRV